MKQKTKSLFVGTYFVFWGLYVGWALIFGEVDSLILAAFAIFFFVGGLWELWSGRRRRRDDDPDHDQGDRPPPRSAT